MCWYAVKSWGDARYVAQMVARSGLQTYCPIGYRWNGQSQNQFGLFPGYFFSWLAETDHYHHLMNWERVAYVVGGYHKHAEIPQDWIENLQSVGPLIEGRRSRYKRNQQVRIILNNLTQLIGKIEKLDLKHSRARVGYTLLGKSHHTWLDFSRLGT